MLFIKCILSILLNFFVLGFYGNLGNVVQGAAILGANLEYQDLDRLYAYEEFCDPYDYQCDDSEYIKIVDFYYTIEYAYR